MVTRASGSGVTKIKGRDQAEVLLFLQRRWEDDKGNIYAQRVGTAVMRIGRDVPQWVNGYRLPILYGDVSQRPDYDPSMDLMDQGLFYALNSKGKMVPRAGNLLGRQGCEADPSDPDVFLRKPGCLYRCPGQCAVGGQCKNGILKRYAEFLNRFTPMNNNWVS